MATPFFFLQDFYNLESDSLFINSNISGSRIDKLQTDLVVDKKLDVTVLAECHLSRATHVHWITVVTTERVHCLSETP
jgi:hypothetical protein